jgi:alkylation response protein AidB-like acyl-CoA dehydrogenase
MKTFMPVSSALKGGEWLVSESKSYETFTPEDFTEEQKMVLEMCESFMNNEVLPLHERIDKTEPGLIPSLLLKAGELGVLGVSIPEEYGGMGKDFITSSIVAEGLGSGGSFSVSFISHTGIGSLPILYFGTEEQRRKYLPKLASGEWKGAYGLTEPNSGSDALGAKTTATLSDDGKHYILNGQKCWITNGGFADVYTVFAKVDGENLPAGKAGFTAFIVERGYEGFTQGEEEHKMGIKGSSTVQLYFQDCKVPVENVLGEIGRGHIIAFNILNIGRYKMGCATTGAGKRAIDLSLRYAVAREQFNTPIANFGAIQHKLADMAIGLWACETATYRIGKWISDREDALRQKGEPFNKAFLSAAEEYAVECAIVKVFGSEMLHFVADEGVQIHGGNGFSDEYLISKVYRDNRINRIFEGTNEINRLLMVDMLLKRALKGNLDLMTPAVAVSKELMSIPELNHDDQTPFATEKKYISNFKKAILLIAGAAVQKFMNNLDKEQEVIMSIADMMIYTFVAESVLLRAMKLAELFGEQGAALQIDMAQTFIYNSANIILNAGKEALNRFAKGDELSMMHIGLRRFTKVSPFDTISARRRIAQKMIEEDNYCF